MDIADIFDSVCRFIEEVFIKISPMIVFCIIGAVIHKISGKTDFRSRRMTKNGCGKAEQGFKVTSLMPACFFVMMLLFIFVYVGASEDGYMDRHPDFRYKVIVSIAVSAVIAFLLLFAVRSMRMFYRKDGVYWEMPFGRKYEIEVSKIIKIEVNPDKTAADIYTMSNGKLHIDSTQTGFEEFCRFAYENWRSKCEIACDD